jgi:hypothetical protein
MALLANAHALVVGIAAYRHINPLPPVVRDDADAVHKLLVDPRYCGYDPQNVRLLLDDQATLEALRRELAALAGRTDDASTVLIYFSCHGGRLVAPPHTGAYLLPVDVAAAPGSAMAESALSGPEFTAALRQIPAQKLFVLLDCCFAGGIGAAKEGVLKGGAGDVYKSGFESADIENLTAGRGRVIFAASRADQPSWILGQATHSLFTQHLLDGLRGGITSQDGIIRIFQLYDYIERNVTRAQPKQQPMFKGDLETNFAVALALGGQKAPAPPAETPPPFEYDAYISYADVSPDTEWVRRRFLPPLEAAGVRVALAHQDEELGLPRLDGIENIVKQAKFVVAVLSRAYRQEPVADFTTVLAQTFYLKRQEYRLIPVRRELLAEGTFPLRIEMLTALKLDDELWFDADMERLIRKLKGPLHTPPPP